MAKPKDNQNALASPTPMDESLTNNALSLLGHKSGTKEFLKAYINQFGWDEGDYTEKRLSPAGIDALRKMAAMNYGVASPQNVNYPQYPDDGDPTGLRVTLGSLAPSNVRKVIIGRVPYWQVLDRYNFNKAADDVEKGKRGELTSEVVNSLMRGKITYDDKRKIPSILGLAYNSNFLVPVDPSRVAPDDLIEAHRKRTSLSNNPAFPTATLGGRAKRWVEQTVMPATPFGGIVE